MPFPCPRFVKKLIEYLERFFALIDHNHDTDYANIDHNHDADYAAIDHNHDTDYAPLDHNHDERYYTETEVDALIAGIQGAMVGEIRMTGIDVYSKSVPDGWLVCDGTQVSRTTYSDLYTAIGEAFGSGDGSTTFNLPNFEGRFPVGSRYYGGNHNMWLGATGGEEYHTLDIDEMPEHDHSQYPNGDIYWRRIGNLDGIPNEWVAIWNANYDPVILVSEGGNQPHENLPPYLAVHFIIYAGVDG